MRGVVAWALYALAADEGGAVAWALHALAACEGVAVSVLDTVPLTCPPGDEKSDAVMGRVTQ